MSNAPRRAKALAILNNTKMWRSNYEPPLLRLLWRLGIDVPPPHFVRFVPMFAFAAAWFASGYGLAMWFFIWDEQGTSSIVAAILSCMAGLFFGLFMAAYYARGRRRYHLPDWKSL